MARLQIELRAEMDNGDVHLTVADQRDVARWEVQPFGCPMSEWDARINLAYRFLAWSALTREQKLGGMTWDQFADRCVEASDPVDDDDQAAAGGDASDPGPPDRSAPTSARSRGARGKR